MESPESTPKLPLTEAEKAEKLALIAQLESKIKEIKTAHDALAAAHEAKNTEQTAKLSQTLRQKLNEGKALKRKLEGKTVESEITANHTRVHEDGKKEEITINLNFESYFDDFSAFYAKHKLTLPPTFETTMRDIWERHYDQIKQEIENHGFDTILLIPGNTKLPELNTTMTKDYKEETKEWISIKDITEATTAPRLVLLHNVAELDQIPELKKTLTKKANDPLIKDETLNFTDYLIFQRKFFEETQKHPDIKLWTWLPGSRGGARVVVAGWCGDRLRVSARGPGDSAGLLGCRLSRLFL